jgi:hypothetical protein
MFARNGIWRRHAPAKFYRRETKPVSGKRDAFGPKRRGLR